MFEHVLPPIVMAKNVIEFNRYAAMLLNKKKKLSHISLTYWSVIEEYLFQTEQIVGS